MTSRVGGVNYGAKAAIGLKGLNQKNFLNFKHHKLSFLHESWKKLSCVLYKELHTCLRMEERTSMKLVRVFNSL